MSTRQSAAFWAGGAIATLAALVALTPANAQPRPRPQSYSLPAIYQPYQPPPPNIVLIVADDVGVDLLRVYKKILQSERQGISDPNCGDDPNCAPVPACLPNLTALRNEGMLFTHAFANPVCSPTRAQIMTGLHGFRNGIGEVVGNVGVRVNRSGIRFADVPLAWELGDNGYTTAAVGKWHMLEMDSTKPTLAERYRLDHPINHDTTTNCGATEYLGAGFDWYAGSPFNVGDPRINMSGAGSYIRWEKNINGTLAEPYCAYATTDTINDAIALIDPDIPLPCADGGSPPCGFSCPDFGLPAAGGALQPRPWFLYVTLNAVHGPFHYLDDFDPNLCPPGPRYESETPCYFCDDDDLNPTGEVKFQQIREMAEAMDEGLGRLLNTVDLTTTYVIFIGDNGTRGDAVMPQRGAGMGKGSLHDGGIRVPMLVAGPGIAGNSTCGGLVSVVDLYSTICELAGSSRRPADSISLLPYLLDPDAAPLRQTIYAEKFTPNFNAVCEDYLSAGIKSNHSQVVRNTQFKLMLLDDLSSKVHFYDMLSDPFEENNLAQDPGNRADPGLGAYLADYCELKCRLVELLGCDQLEPNDICDCNCP